MSVGKIDVLFRKRARAFHNKRLRTFDLKKKQSVPLTSCLSEEGGVNSLCCGPTDGHDCSFHFAANNAGNYTSPPQLTVWIIHRELDGYSDAL